ncbi:hypothetical protein BKA82DRAFT_125612 [Pisolithus tinctorius]|uniref:Uncharacterized protein n=1 Tax=Pisolithus tinctorius Marx 270 TaxID=870435 RepID=A0A0C3PSI1_PISTI|nr:hypothetical protein BKA82DRAFT_125612 [Pisolithus tinctorius]KIO12111.1 hypothetical protein M404DRAFT_125612 [Pisolithus tinctorius Marx 270]
MHSLSGNYGAFNGHILARYNDHWITSPNADFVPEPFLFKRKTIMLCHNSRFGHIDCFQWPQLYAEHYMWAGCIP